MTESSHTGIELVSQFVEQLQACATPREVYAVAGQTCAEIFSPLSGSISIMDPPREMLATETRWGETGGMRTFGPAACLALRSVRPSVSRPTGPRCAHLAGSDARGCLCVPLVSDGKTTGVIHLSPSAAGIGRSADDELEDGVLRHLAIIVAAQLSMALANLGLRDSLRQMAIRDPLTGLFNRRFMEETLDRELNRAARSSSEVAIVMIDLDHFKAFNDAHGHEAGDAVLAAVGEVLRRYSRTSDVACRFGGEEFLMILPDCTLAYARLRADELRRRVSALYLCSRGIELPGSTISCGVAVSPMHGHRPEDLIFTAATALYTAKRSGRDRVALAPLADSHTMTDR